MNDLRAHCSINIEVAAVRAIMSDIHARRRAALCSMRKTVWNAWSEIVEESRKQLYNTYPPEAAAVYLLDDDVGKVVSGVVVCNLAKRMQEALIGARKLREHRQLIEARPSGQTLLFVLDVVCYLPSYSHVRRPCHRTCEVSSSPLFF